MFKTFLRIKGTVKNAMKNEVELFQQAPQQVRTYNSYHSKIIKNAQVPEMEINRVATVA